MYEEKSEGEHSGFIVKYGNFMGFETRNWRLQHLCNLISAFFVFPPDLQAWDFSLPHWLKFNCLFGKASNLIADSGQIVDSRWMNEMTFWFFAKLNRIPKSFNWQRAGVYIRFRSIMVTRSPRIVAEFWVSRSTTVTFIRKVWSLKFCPRYISHFEVSTFISAPSKGPNSFYPVKLAQNTVFNRLLCNWVNTSTLRDETVTNL